MMLLRWRIMEARRLQWRGPQGVLPAIASRPATQLAAFLVPAASAGLTEGDGIQVIGSEVRINIESLPSAPGA